MLPSGELLIRRVDDEDKYRSYQCRAVNRLTGATLLSVGRAKFSVTGNQQTMRSQLSGALPPQQNWKTLPILLVNETLVTVLLEQWKLYLHRATP
jgi:hypothetical protein